MMSSRGRRRTTRSAHETTCAQHVAEALRFVAHRRWNSAQRALMRGWEASKLDENVRARALCCRLLTELHRLRGDLLSSRQFLQLALDAEASAWGVMDCEFSADLQAAAARECADRNQAFAEP